MYFSPVHPIGERVFFAAYLTHAKRAEGLLREYRARFLLTAALTGRAHAAWEDLRTADPDERYERAAQF